MEKNISILLKYNNIILIKGIGIQIFKVHDNIRCHCKILLQLH